MLILVSITGDNTSVLVEQVWPYKLARTGKYDKHDR